MYMRFCRSCASMVTRPLLLAHFLLGALSRIGLGTTRCDPRLVVRTMSMLLCGRSLLQAAFPYRYL